MRFRCRIHVVCLGERGKNAFQDSLVWQGAEVNNSDVFVPPNPKEFDKAACICIFFDAFRGVNASVNTGSALVRLSVNGAIP